MKRIGREPAFPYPNMPVGEQRYMAEAGFHDGYQGALDALAPCLEASDALAEAVRELLQDAPLYTTWGERAPYLNAEHALAAYDAARKGEADG